MGFSAHLVMVKSKKGGAIQDSISWSNLQLWLLLLATIGRYREQKPTAEAPSL